MDAEIEDWYRNYEVQRTREQEAAHAAGERTLLTRWLRKRFGELPPSVVARLDSAGAADLEHWSDRVLDAARLADVFDDH